MDRSRRPLVELQLVIQPGSMRAHLGRGVLAASLGVFLHLFLAHRWGMSLGLPLDDAWIHSAFAKHLAQDLRWSMFATGPTGGESSPLWPWLLVPGEWIPGLSAPILALFLGVAAWLVLPTIVGVLHPDPGARVPLIVAVSMCGPLLFHALSGMETIPALTLGAAALLSFAQGHSRRAAYLAGAAAWLRVDAAMMLAVLAVGELDHRRHEGKPLGVCLRETAGVLWPGAILAALAAAWLAGWEGRFPPSTLDGRRWALGLPADVALADQGWAIRAFLVDWARALGNDLGFGRWSALWPAQPGFALRWTWKLIAATALALGAIRLVRTAGRPRAEATLRLLLVWTVWALFFYSIVLPDRGHVGRYQPQVFLLSIAVALTGVRAIGSSGLRWVVGLVLALGLATSVVYGGFLWVRGIQHLDGVHRKAARELPARVGNGHLAVFDVGLVAYEYDGPVTDLSGLSDPDLLLAIRTRQLVRELRRREVTHVLLPVFHEDGPGSLRDRLGLLDVDGVVLEPVVSYQTPDERWAAAFGYSGNAFRRVVLYRLDPPRAASAIGG